MNKTDLAKKIPVNDREAWLKYPKINWLYDTARLLEFQNIKWYPFPISEVTQTHLSANSIGTGLIGLGKKVYIEKDLDLHEINYDETMCITEFRTKVDLIVHKGALVHEVYYRENSLGVVKVSEQLDSGELELKIVGLLAWHLNKFCGVISVEYVNNIIIAVRLKPNDKAEEFYPHVVFKKLKALYTRRQWTQLPVL